LLFDAGAMGRKEGSERVARKSTLKTFKFRHYYSPASAPRAPLGINYMCRKSNAQRELFGFFYMTWEQKHNNYRAKSHLAIELIRKVFEQKSRRGKKPFLGVQY
jgi:hypothetical protein